MENIMKKIFFLIILLFGMHICYADVELTEEGFFAVCEKYKTPEMIEFWRECTKIQKNKWAAEIREDLRKQMEAKHKE